MSSDGSSPGDIPAISSFSGSPEGIFASPGDARCCEDRICNCLAGSLQVIARATMGIWQSMQRKQEGPCDHIDQCIDKIIDKLRDKLEKPAKSCDECKQMAAAGLRGSMEYAFQCAGACIEETETVCSMSDPESEGKPCKGCGKEPCCCVEGVCSPCPEDEEDEKKWTAWCNPATGAIQVRLEKAGPLSFPWQLVGLTETELAAIALAEANCKKFETETQPAPPIQLPRIPFPAVACNLNNYSSGTAIQQFAGNIDSVLQVAGWAQVATNLGEIGVGGLTIENFGSIVTGILKSWFSMPMKFSNQIVDSLSSVIDCNHPEFAKITQLLMNLGIAQKFTGVDLSDFTTKYRYALSALCRQKYLDPDKAIAAYFGNSIDDGQLDTQWAIHGLCPDALQWYKHAARAKPTPLQLAIMRRREIINGAEYDLKMRELGYLESGTRDDLFAITEQVPSMSAIIQFMVRDADDESVVNRFGLDAEFDNKYGRQLKEWAADQGVPELMAKYSWRSHWTIPAPGQLFQFWHRLRDNPKFGGKEKLLDDIKAALIQQDILPFWHDYYLAVSFRPMFRRDIRRAYEIGALDDQQMRDAYIQLGHSDEVADQLAKFTERLRDKRLPNRVEFRLWREFAIDRAELVKRLKADGIPDAAIQQAVSDYEQRFDKSPFATAFAKGDISRQVFINELLQVGVSQAGATKIADRVSLRINNHPAMKGYQVGAMSKVDAISKATADGMNNDIALNLIDVIDQEVSYQLLTRCQNGIKRRFLDGEMNKGEALNELKARGTVPARAAQIADEWDCEKEAIGKSIPTSTLCQLVESGAITANSMRDRLENIGYTQDDADLITGNCLEAISERRKKKDERERKAEESEERRRQREIAKANAALAREAKALERARITASNIRKRRERQLISAAEKVHDQCECDLFAAIGAVRTGREHVIQTYGLSIDETHVVLIKAAEAMEKGNLDSYNSAVNQFAEIAAAEPFPTNGQAQSN